MVEQMSYNAMGSVQAAPYNPVRQSEPLYVVDRKTRLLENRRARDEEKARWERDIRFIDSICK